MELEDACLIRSELFDSIQEYTRTLKRSRSVHSSPNKTQAFLRSTGVDWQKMKTSRVSLHKFLAKTQKVSTRKLCILETLVVTTAKITFYYSTDTGVNTITGRGAFQFFVKLCRQRRKNYGSLQPKFIFKTKDKTVCLFTKEELKSQLSKAKEGVVQRFVPSNQKKSVEARLIWKLNKSTRGFYLYKEKPPCALPDLSKKPSAIDSILEELRVINEKLTGSSSREGGSLLNIQLDRSMLLSSTRRVSDSPGTKTSNKEWTSIPTIPQPEITKLLYIPNEPLEMLENIRVLFTQCNIKGPRGTPEELIVDFFVDSQQKWYFLEVVHAKVKHTQPKKRRVSLKKRRKTGKHFDLNILKPTDFEPAEHAERLRLQQRIQLEYEKLSKTANNPTTLAVKRPDPVWTYMATRSITQAGLITPVYLGKSNSIANAKKPLDLISSHYLHQKALGHIQESVTKITRIESSLHKKKLPAGHFQATYGGLRCIKSIVAEFFRRVVRCEDFKPYTRGLDQESMHKFTKVFVPIFAFKTSHHSLCEYFLDLSAKERAQLVSLFQSTLTAFNVTRADQNSLVAELNYALD